MFGVKLSVGKANKKAIKKEKKKGSEAEIKTMGLRANISKRYWERREKLTGQEKVCWEQKIGTDER